jgi:hypothetical protein
VGESILPTLADTLYYLLNPVIILVILLQPRPVSMPRLDNAPAFIYQTPFTLGYDPAKLEPRFSHKYFRVNLKSHLPIPADMVEAEAHHMLPKTFRTVFWDGWKIDVNDPIWGAWVNGGGQHQDWSDAYNMMWESWLNTNVNATIWDVICQARYMADVFGIDWPW